MNKVIILGRLGQDPTLKLTQSGLSISNLSIATSKKIKDKETTEWHRIVVFGKTAENCKKYLSKGSMALVEGELQTKTYEKNGVKHYSTEILANHVQFVGSKSDQPSPSPSQAPDQNFPQNVAEPQQEPLDPTLYEGIPF